MEVRDGCVKGLEGRLGLLKWEYGVQKDRAQMNREPRHHQFQRSQ